MELVNKDKPRFGKLEYSPQKLIRELAEHPNIVEALKKYPPKKSWKSLFRNPVNEYLKEMIATPSAMTTNFASKTLDGVWSRIFKDIEVRGTKELKEQAKDKQLIYLPCHRSHFDYLLVSYVLHHHCMELPHIIAGNNLNLAGVGKILKNGGAVFMRRVIKSNPLYATVFITYLHYLLDNGFPLEVFIEGGRSRTGKNLPPKIGLISILIDYLIQRPEKDLHLAPVSITYERLPEEGVYLKELEGEEKRKESLFEMFNAVKVIKKNFGKAFVSFGPLMSLRKLMTEYAETNGFEDIPKTRTPEFKQMAYSFGMEVMDQINIHTRISPLPIVAAAFLSEWRRGFQKNELLEKSRFLLDVYHASHSRARDVLVESKDGLEGIIDFLIQGGSVRRIHDPDGDIYYFTSKDKIRLSLYKNILAHYFVIPSIIALKIKQGVKNRDVLLEHILFFDNLLRYEFMFPRSYDFTEAVDGMLDFALKRELIAEKDGEYFPNPDKEVQLNILANIIRPFLDSFQVAINVFTSQKAGFPAEKKKLIRVLRETHHKLLLLGRIFTIEGNLTVSYQNILKFFAEENILTSRTENRQTFIGKGDDFKKIHDLSERLFAAVSPIPPTS